MAQKNVRRRGRAASKVQSTGILVLGMHRSGTSALTGALARLGVSLGHGLVEPGPDNPAGYFENARAVTLDERLLHALGRGWDDLRELPTDWLASPPAMQARSALTALLDEEFADATVWAIKDPRLCRLLPLWRDVLARRGVDPFCLFVVRDPAQVSASLHRRDGMDDEYAALMWCQHLLVAERDSRGLRRAMIDYEQLLSEPLPTLDAIAAAIGIAWPVQTHHAEAELFDFLRPDRQHHRGAPILSKGPAGVLAARLFAQCRNILERGGDWAVLAAALSRLQRLVQRAVPALSPWLQVLSKTRHRLDVCDERFGAVDRSLRDVQDLSRSRLATVEAQEQQLVQAHAALDEVTQLALQRLATVEAQEQQLVQVHAALDEVTQLALQRLATIEAQDQQLTKAHAALDEVTQQSLQLQAAVQTLTNEIAVRDREIESDRGLLTQTRAELSALHEALRQVYASRSWRLTKPLRRASAWFRRLSGGAHASGI